MAAKDVLEAIYDYIENYTGIDSDRIYRGWQNRMALPITNEYIVYYIKDTKRVGTNIRRWEIDDELNANDVLREFTVAIDVYDIDHERALERMEAIEIMARSMEGIKFLKKRGVYLYYADDFRLIPFTDSNNQYIYRYNIELHLSRWDDVETEQQYAAEVEIQKEADVIVIDPETEEPVIDPETGEPKTERKLVFANIDELDRDK